MERKENGDSIWEWLALFVYFGLAAIGAPFILWTVAGFLEELAAR